MDSRAQRRVARLGVNSFSVTGGNGQRCAGHSRFVAGSVGGRGRRQVRSQETAVLDANLPFIPNRVIRPRGACKPRFVRPCVVVRLPFGDGLDTEPAAPCIAGGEHGAPRGSDERPCSRKAGDPVHSRSWACAWRGPYLGFRDEHGVLRSKRDIRSRIGIHHPP